MDISAASRMNTRATQVEEARPMAADTMISDPLRSFTRAITIDTHPEDIWPWLAQMGAGRAGWYSYDFVDNGGAPSAWKLIPEHQSVSVGDVFPALPGADDAFVVAEVDPGRELVLTASTPAGELLATWDFALQPATPDGTRLVVRSRVGAGWPGKPSGTRPIELVYRLLAMIPQPLMITVAKLGHGVMEAKMLQGIKRRAEARNRR